MYILYHILTEDQNDKGTISCCGPQKIILNVNFNILFIFVIILTIIIIIIVVVYSINY